MLYFLKIITTLVFTYSVSFLEIKDNANTYQNIHRINNLESRYSYSCYDYTEPHLSCIAGIVEQYLKLTSPSDIIIAPGRSTIHYMNSLQALGEIDATFKRTLFIPAFSRGRLFFPHSPQKLQEIFDSLTPVEKIRMEEIRKNIQESIEEKVNFKKAKISKDQAQYIVSRFESSTNFMFSFKNNKVMYVKDYVLEEKDVNAYKDYLVNIVKINKELLKNCKGKIVITDSLVIGESVKAFIKILSEIMEETEDEIKEKIKIINVDYGLFMDPEGLFPDIKIENIIIDENKWVDFSYNYLADQSFFFPPWSWSQKNLWNSPVSNHHQFMKNKLKEYMADVFIDNPVGEYPN